MPSAVGIEGDQKGVEAVDRAGDGRHDGLPEQHAEVVRPRQQQQDRDDEEDVLDPEHRPLRVEDEHQADLAAEDHVADADDHERERAPRRDLLHRLEDAELDLASERERRERRLEDDDRVAHGERGDQEEERHQRRVPERMQPRSGQQHQRAE